MFSGHWNKILQERRRKKNPKISVFCKAQKCSGTAQLKGFIKERLIMTWVAAFESLKMVLNILSIINALLGEIRPLKSRSGARDGSRKKRERTFRMVKRKR